MKVFITALLVAVAVANPIRPDEAAALAEQQALLAQNIHKNNVLHGSGQPLPGQAYLVPQYNPYARALYAPQQAYAVAGVRPDEAAALAEQQALLAQNIHKNNVLHGSGQPLPGQAYLGYNPYARALPYYAPQQAYAIAGVRPDEAAAIANQNAQLAGLIAQQEAINRANSPLAYRGSNAVHAILSNPPIPNVNNPADTVAQQQQLQQLAHIVQSQRLH